MFALLLVACGVPESADSAQGTGDTDPATSMHVDVYPRVLSFDSEDFEGDRTGFDAENMGNPIVHNGSDAPVRVQVSATPMPDHPDFYATFRSDVDEMVEPDGVLLLHVDAWVVYGEDEVPSGVHVFTLPVMLDEDQIDVTATVTW